MKDEKSDIHTRAAYVTFRTNNDFRLIDKRQGANLPHWTTEGAIYHVTYRLFDALPTKVLEDLMKERELLNEKLNNPNNKLTFHEKRRLNFLYSERIDGYLDAGHGECWLARREIAQIIAENLNHFNMKRYELFAWTVMPNHVHVILQPLTGFTLPDILHSWKSYTSKKANKLLGRSGKFWRQESYNRILRNSDELLYYIDYVYCNPVKAGFTNWEWRWKTNT